MGLFWPADPRNHMEDARLQYRLTCACFAVMDRDRRLTGFLRGQTDRVLAPAGFELSNGWRVSHDSPEDIAYTGIEFTTIQVERGFM